MNEINIILDSNIDTDESLNILRNDKKVLFNNINKTLNILNLNSHSNFSNDLIEAKLEDFLYIDNYIDFLSDLDITYLNKSNNFESDVLSKTDDTNSIQNNNSTKKESHSNSIFSKKILIKKLLELLNPIINEDNRLNNTVKSNYIIDKNQISLNFPIKAKYINPKSKNKELNNYIIPSVNYFNVVGIYNEQVPNFNIPYILNEFNLELNNIFKLIKSHNFIKYKPMLYIKDLKYNNKILFSIEHVDITQIINLYKLALTRFNLYVENKEMSYLLYNISKTKFNMNTPQIDVSDLINSQNDLLEYNKFLNTKIGSYIDKLTTNSNNIYNSFNNDGLLHLYEMIRLHTLDNEDIKKIIKRLLLQQQNKLEYNKNMTLLNNKILINNKLEYIAKSKFPNLFNINSNDNIFNQFSKFDINKLPKKYKEIVILDLKKQEDYIQNQLYNKCKHKELLKSFYNNKLDQNAQYKIFQDILKFITRIDDTRNKGMQKNQSANTNLLKCNVCTFNILCPHVLDYYILYFNRSSNGNFQKNADFIHQKILNKYMSKAPIDMMYFCKICGEELGKSQDMEQNVEFKDNERTNTLEYSDDTSHMIKNTVSYLVYTYISFKGIGLTINKQQIIKYIIDNISLLINNIEKKLRKSKNYENEKILNILHFNIIIFTYASLIFIMNKYNNIVFNKLSRSYSKGAKVSKGTKSNIYNNIIVKKKKVSGSKNMNAIKENFRSAYDLIVNTNSLLLSKLDYNKNSEIIKNILIKAYSFINGSVELELDTKKNNNLELIHNGSIYQYYYNIVNTYPITISNKNTTPRKNITMMVNNSNTESHIATLKKVQYNDYKNIIGNIDITSSSKKLDYLFENVPVPKYITGSNNISDISNLTVINNYSEYKYYSFLLFMFFIKNRIYELPIYKFINLSKCHTKNNLYLDVLLDINDKSIVDIDKDYDTYREIYSIYINKSKILKEYELTLIKNNLNFNLYPYSKNKLNNSRYYYHSKFKDINLHVYICKQDGNLHKYHTYVYDLDNKEHVIVNKNIDKNIDIVTNKNTKFIDYQCNKCKLNKNHIINESKTDGNNKDIDLLIINKNEIVQFYHIYRYKCPLSDFHIFDNSNICTVCKMSSNDILTENIDIFNKFKTNYNKYINALINLQNNILVDNIKKNTELQNIDTILNYKKQINIMDSNVNTTNEFIKNIDNIILDDLFVFISKISNIDIKYFKILGLTEGIDYSAIDSIIPNYSNIDNRFIKISNYIRTLSIYYNLLINHDKITQYHDYEFLEIINNIKKSNISTKLKSNIDITNKFKNINLIDMYNFIKLTIKDNKYIIEFGLKILFNKIKEIYTLNEKLNNELDVYIQFIIHKIFKFDELFTNFNYSELKQMFSQNAPNFDSMFDNNISVSQSETDGLFGYNDVDVDFGDVDD